MSDTTQEIRHLVDMPLAQLRARYEEIFGESTDSRDTAYLARRIAFALITREREDERDERQRKPRFTAADIASGRAKILRCDKCRRPRVVSAEFVAKLKHMVPNHFYCSECRKDHARRAPERAGLERTRKQIERERARRPR